MQVVRDWERLEHMIKCELKHFAYLDNSAKNLFRKTRETSEELQKLKMSINHDYVKQTVPTVKFVSNKHKSQDSSIFSQEFLPRPSIDVEDIERISLDPYKAKDSARTQTLDQT